MRRYTFQIIITEGSDEFWEEIKGSGVDEVIGAVTQALDDAGFTVGYGTEIKLIKFEDKD